MYRWAKIVLFRIPLDFGLNFAWSLWSDISKESSQKTEDATIVGFLVRKYKSERGHLSIASKMWILVLVMTILFSSVHQT
ncbi:hypothetical protein N7492_000093 [Penicillium capsulatum]|uniref:Uncharacterized protein n=1 Tax=Penicillium capsulatum TaxID=69766 RepID=A0A9W9IR56_9EURO|nr:hypothetical protein N7492_000093 [Penicillium capsulatum]